MKNLSKMLTFGAAVLFFGCANAVDNEGMG